MIRFGGLKRRASQRQLFLKPTDDDLIRFIRLQSLRLPRCQIPLLHECLGVFLAHLTQVFAYVFIVLKGPYRAFDPRYRAVSLGLNADPLRFWSAVKLGMMKPTLAAAAAVGIGVSIAQYVPTAAAAARVGFIMPSFTADQKRKGSALRPSDTAR